MPSGTPFPFDEDIFQEILEQIANSKEGVKKILSEKEYYPGKTTFDKWLNEDKSRTDRYARAKSEQAEILVDEILDIADSCNADIVGFDEETGKPIIDGQIVQRARLMIDSRKWLAGKLKPKKYGEKIEIETTEREMTFEEKLVRIKQLQEKLNTTINNE